mmetsp:Transcript_27942/g.83557  ORF Transcript_27942/g.83557 Transcript_27942/m.83557 type:complete len:131 (-) Transcript_27942:75-467(-)
MSRPPRPLQYRGPRALLWLVLLLQEAAFGAAALINRHVSLVRANATRREKKLVPPRFTPLPQLAACGQLMARHPDGVRCPAECPFLRIEPNHMCQFTCVPAKELVVDEFNSLRYTFATPSRSPSPPAAPC